jgi:GNAT superfamily N-acetyltransferase
MECRSAPESVLAIPNDYTVDRESFSVEDYLALYRKIGGPVGWDLRLKLSSYDLQKILTSPESRCFVLRQGIEVAGLCELCLANTGEAELQYFGLVPSFQRQGLSVPFLQIVLCNVFKEGANRIWLHTDEEDSPAAQKVYGKVGFTNYERKFMDPTPL